MAKAKTPTQVRELTAAAHNPRAITEDRSKQLAKSMAAFGDLSSITWNRRSGRLVSGHQRVKHLQPNAKITDLRAMIDDAGTIAIGRITSGMRSWPYREVDWDDAREKAACIAANAAGGRFDDVKLGRLVRELDGAGVDLDLLNLDSLEDILSGANEPVEPEDEPMAGPAGAPTARRGDLLTLGRHRLMCGDSTDPDDVARLMGQEAAHLVFTDPPYGVSYDAKSGEFAVIEGDRKRDDALYQLVAGALTQAAEHTKDDAAFYVWHASATRREFEDALRAAGLTERQYIIWAKPAAVLGRADYHWAHEPCFYAGKSGRRPAWHGDRAQPTVWRASLKARAGVATTLGSALVLTDGAGGQLALTPALPKGKKSRSLRLARGQGVVVEVASGAKDVWDVARESDYVHPTQKPVELARTAIVNSTKPGQIVLDPFGGSGSTLMAAEATGRAARLIELDPRYVDAIVARWEAATEQKATKEAA